MLSVSSSKCLVNWLETNRVSNHSVFRPVIVVVLLPVVRDNDAIERASGKKERGGLSRNRCLIMCEVHHDIVKKTGSLLNYPDYGSITEIRRNIIYNIQNTV